MSVCVCGHVYEEAVEVQNQNWWRLWGAEVGQLTWDPSPPPPSAPSPRPQTCWWPILLALPWKGNQKLVRCSQKAQTIFYQLTVSGLFFSLSLESQPSECHCKLTVFLWWKLPFHRGQPTKQREHRDYGIRVPVIKDEPSPPTRQRKVGAPGDPWGDFILSERPGRTERKSVFLSSFEGELLLC